MYGVSHQGVRGEPCTLLWMKMLGESGFVSRIVLFHSSLLCEPLRVSSVLVLNYNLTTRQVEGGMEAEKAVQFPIDRAHSVNEDVRTKKGNVRIGVSSQKKT